MIYEKQKVQTLSFLKGLGGDGALPGKLGT